MDDATLLLEIAQAIDDLLTIYHRMVVDVTSTTDLAPLHRILEELMLMETIFPELAKTDSPTAQLQQMMEHLGDGALHSRYPLITTQPFAENLTKLLGDGPGIYIRSSLAVFDVYYINGFLTKAHLRDGVWTDVTQYCGMLGLPERILPTTESDPATLSFWATVTIVPNSADADDLWCASRGATLALIERVCQSVEASRSTDSRPKVVLNVVDTSYRGWSGGIALNLEEVAEFLNINADTRPYADPEEFNRTLIGLDERALSDGQNTVFVHANTGKSIVVHTNTLTPVQVSLLDFIPKLSIYGNIEYRVIYNPDMPGRTTIAPFIREHRQDNLAFSSQIYHVGDVVECAFSGWGIFNIVTKTQIPGAKYTQREVCPICAQRTIRLSFMRSVCCTNQTCPGIVAARLECLADDKTGFFLPAFVEYDTCLQTVLYINQKEGRPLTLPELLHRLSHYLDSGELFPDWPRDCENIKLHEMLDYVLDLIALEPTNRACWQYTRALIRAMGFRNLSDVSLKLLIKSAQSRMQPPFPYITTVLLDPKLLDKVGIYLDAIVVVVMEANHRRAELQSLNALFSVTKGDTDRRSAERIASVIPHCRVDAAHTVTNPDTREAVEAILTEISVSPINLETDAITLDSITTTIENGITITKF